MLNNVIVAKLIGGLGKLLGLLFVFNRGQASQKAKQTKAELKQRNRANEIDDTNKRKSNLVILDELRDRDSRD